MRKEPLDSRQRGNLASPCSFPSWAAPEQTLCGPSVLSITGEHPSQRLCTIFQVILSETGTGHRNLWTQSPDCCPKLLHLLSSSSSKTSKPFNEFLTICFHQEVCGQYNLMIVSHTFREISKPVEKSLC